MGFQIGNQQKKLIDHSIKGGNNRKSEEGKVNTTQKARETKEKKNTVDLKIFDENKKLLQIQMMIT